MCEEYGVNEGRTLVIWLEKDSSLRECMFKEEICSVSNTSKISYMNNSKQSSKLKNKFGPGR